MRDIRSGLRVAVGSLAIVLVGAAAGCSSGSGGGGGGSGSSGSGSGSSSGSGGGSSTGSSSGPSGSAQCPAGSYGLACDEIECTSTEITALCRNNAGDMVSTSLPLPCDSVSDCNGVLVCTPQCQSSPSTTTCGFDFNAAACGSCVQSECCSVTETCANDAACMAIVTCSQGCASGDTACGNACFDDASSSAQSELTNATNCWSSSCGNSGC